MKKSTVILFSLFIFLQQGYSQWSAGVLNGINISNSTSNREIPQLAFSSLMNYQVAVFAEYELSSKLKVATTVGFSPKGFQSVNAGANSFTSGNRNSYLEFLPSMKVELLKNMRLGLGPSLGFKLNEQYRLNENATWMNGVFDFNKTFDFGVFGLLDYRLKSFIFQVLVNRGVTNFNDNVFFTDLNGDSLGTVKAFNLNYQFSVGYVIDFNKKA